MLFGYGLVYCINLLLNWEVPGWGLLIVAIILEAIHMGRTALKKKGIRIDLYLMCVLATFILFFAFRWNKIPYCADFTDYYMHFSFIEKMDVRYGIVLLIVIIGLGNLFYQYITKNLYSNIVFSCILIGILIVQTLAKLEWELFPAAAWVCVSLNGLLGGYLKFSDKDLRKKSGRAYYPLLLLVALLIIIRPNPAHPISWKPVINAWENVKTTTNDMVCRIIYGSREQVFDTANGGFDQTDRGFWGSLTDTSQQKLMKVEFRSGRETGDPYFIGTIYENYEDNRWNEQQVSKIEQEAEYYWDISERVYNIYQSRAASEQDSHFCKQSIYNLRYLNLRSKMLFYPRNCSSISLQNVKGNMVIDNSNVVFDKKQKKNNFYEVSGVQFNFSNPEFLNYVKYGVKGSAISEEGIYDEAQAKLSLTMDEKRKIIHPDTGEKIKRKKAEIEKQDLQLPASISQEVYNLAVNLTENEDNDYDKAQAIVAYLKESGEYKYSKKTQGVPENAEAVEYFLFQNKQGYCKHFATSAVILLRCAGIPARYVEGAYITYGISGKEDTYILGKDAHAWAQVYLENYGWLDLDPTPGYGAKSSFKVKIRTDYTPNLHNQEDIKEEQSKEQIEEEKKEWTQTASSLFAIIVLSILLIGLLSGGFVGINRFRYHHSTNKEKMESCIKKIFYLRKRRRLPLGNNETLREYMLRVGCEKELEECVQIFEKNRYGNYEITNDEVCVLEQQCKTERIVLKEWRKGNRKNWLVLLKKRINDKIRKSKNKNGGS